MQNMKIVIASGMTLALAVCFSAHAAQKANVGSVATKPTAQQTEVMQKVKPQIKGGGVKVGGATVAELTAGECTKLGCTTQEDKACYAVIIGSGFQISTTVHKRCVCSGGSQCITEAKE